MTQRAWVKDLFATIDRMDSEGFAAFLTEEGSFKFGNWPEARGREAVAKAVGDFFAGIAGISHELVGVWDNEGATVVEGSVTYTRHDGSKLSVPFANILRHGDGDGDEITDYRIYADVNELFQTAA